MSFTRRELLQTGVTAGAAFIPAVAAGQPVVTPRPSLNELGRAKGLRFGSAISAGGRDPRHQGGSILNPAYAAVVTGECGLIVPENEMKMYAIQPALGVYNFEPADRLVAFAARNGLAIRGHNLLWHNTKWLPGWLKQHDFGSASAAEKFLVDYITTVCR